LVFVEIEMKKRTPRIDVDISIPTASKTRLFVDEDVANVLRKVARAERMELSPFLEMLLRRWLASERPDWKVVDQPDKSFSSRRRS
jgi:hypothetical protein